jgi:hypothetical protein
LAIAAAALVGGLASPAAAQDATSGATVGGGGGTPIIECGWALNDVDHNWGTTPRMQYGQDDNSTSNPGAPCVASGDVATMPDGLPTGAPMIHVQPNADDNPTQAFVELWGAVTSSVATPIVYWEVFHPGPANDGQGSFKVQVDGTKFASSATPDACFGPLSTPPVPGPMWQAAIATGQVTTGAQNNIIAECRFQTKKLFYGAFGISKHQPYGVYRIVLHAANPGGGEDTLTYYINVLPFINLAKDFTNIDFGTVLPNAHSWQLAPGGDFVFPNTASSVKNLGNQGASLGVQFAHMCLSTTAVGSTGCTDDKRIDHFDVKFGTNIANLQSLGDVSLATALVSDTNNPTKLPSGTGVFNPALQYNFDNDRFRTLCPNDIGKIEFSIWTENIQSGIYNGAIRLVAFFNSAKRCDTDNGAPYLVNNTGSDSAPATPSSNTHWAAGGS